MMNLMTIKETYFKIEARLDELNRFEKSNFLGRVYKTMKSEYNIDLKGRATIYSKKDAKGNILEPYYYFIANEKELDLFNKLCLKSMNEVSQEADGTVAAKTEYTKSIKSDYNIYMLIKIINKINLIYTKLSEDIKNDFEKKLMKNLTINKCNVYNREAKNIDDIKSYIENQNQFILNLSSRFNIEDIENIIKAMQKTKEELKLA